MMHKSIESWIESMKEHQRAYSDVRWEYDGGKRGFRAHRFSGGGEEKLFILHHAAFDSMPDQMKKILEAGTGHQFIRWYISGYEPALVPAKFARKTLDQAELEKDVWVTLHSARVVGEDWPESEALGMYLHGDTVYEDDRDAIEGAALRVTMLTRDKASVHIPCMAKFTVDKGLFGGGSRLITVVEITT